MSPRVPGCRSGEQAAEDFTRPLAVTFFQDAGASRKSEVSTTLLSLAEKIRNTCAPEKAKLPWLKLARFGNDRTDKGSLRHDRNVMSISGVEADYDAGTMSFEDAAERLLKAGILSLIYTSPRHCAEAPRWRVLCPTSVELDPGQRQWMLGRLNGVLRGIISQESWTLSQSYYFGRVNQNPLHQVRPIEGSHIDLLDHLDEGWWGKETVLELSAGASTTAGRPFNEQELLDQIVTGESYHVACIRLLGRWARAGLPMMVRANGLFRRWKPSRRLTETRDGRCAGTMWIAVSRTFTSRRLGSVTGVSPDRRRRSNEPKEDPGASRSIFSLTMR